MMKTKLMKAGTALTLLFVSAQAAMAQQGAGIGGVASTLTTQLRNVVPLIVIAAFLLGLFFAVQAFMKLKAHKEDPRENPMGSIMLNAAAATFLIFLGGAITITQGTFGVGSTTVGGGQSVTYQ